MDIINTNHLRVSVRRFRPGYGEYFTQFSYGSYNSADHDQPRLETTYFLRLLGIVADVKYRPDGKRAAQRRSGE